MSVGQELRRRGRALRRWGAIGKPLWLTLAGLVAFILGPYFGLPNLLLVDPIERFRISGAVLQIIGLMSVAFGLHRSRKLFERPGPWKTFMSWMRELAPVFQKRKQKNHTISLVQGMALSAQASITTSDGKNASLEERVAHLEKLCAELRKELRSEVREIKQDQETGLSEEERVRSETDQKLERQLEEAVIGGIHIEFMGLTFLAFGVVLGTIPEQIALLFGL